MPNGIPEIGAPPTRPMVAPAISPDIAEKLGEALEDIVVDEHIQEGEERREDEKKEQQDVQYQLDSGEKEKIVAYIKKLVDTATTSRATWKSNLDECLDLYNGVRAPKSDPWPMCFSKDTEVLTSEGWKVVTDIIKGDKVYSVNPKTNIARYAPVIDSVKTFANELISFKNKSVDLQVVPNHKMYVRYYYSKQNKFIFAKDLVKHPSHKHIPLTSEWRGSNPKKIYGFNAEDFMEFLGWYISEGWTYKSGTIGIGQKNHCQEIEQLLARMGMKYSYRKKPNYQFLISCKKFPIKLREELKDLGKCDKKYIPRKYLDMSNGLLKILLDSLTLGDGHFKNRKGRVPAWSIYTTSKLLADNIQELAQKIGLRAIIHLRDDRGREFEIRGKKYKTKLIGYVIQLCFKQFSRADRLEIKTIKYNDYVYSPTTTPYHTLYVRRNGIAVWSGNCSNVSTMVVPTHCKLMHARLFPTVWNENMIHWRPVEKGDVPNVEKVGTFMNWVIRQEMKLADTIDDILHDLVVIGTIALKIRWDTEYRKVRDKDGEIKEIARQRAYVENVPIDEVYLPYLWKGEDDSEFIAQDVFMRLPEIQDFIDRKKFTATSEEVEKIIGTIDSHIPEGIRRKSGEHEGSAEYYAHRDSHPIRLIECCMPWTINGEITESVFVVSYDGSVYFSGKPLTAISPFGRRPWVIGQFIRRTNRPYGVGLPEIMKGLAKELDAIHNQRIDAGSVTIAPFGFYRAASSFKPEKIQISPGAMIPVDDINDVKLAQFQANFIASFQEERIIIEFLEKLTATSAYQMGRESEIAKSRATATGTLAIISQGERAYTLLGMRCQRIISRMLTKILQMYQAFMPSGLAERVLGEESGELLFPEGLSIEELAGGYDAYMTLDPTIGSKAMERQANSVMIQMAQTFLAISQDPRGYRMAEDFLKSIGKVDVERYLGPRPQEIGTAGGLGALGQGGLPVSPEGAGAGVGF